MVTLLEELEWSHLLGELEWQRVLGELEWSHLLGELEWSRVLGRLEWSRLRRSHFQWQSCIVSLAVRGGFEWPHL